MIYIKVIFNLLLVQITMFCKWIIVITLVIKAPSMYGYIQTECFRNVAVFYNSWITHTGTQMTREQTFLHYNVTGINITIACPQENVHLHNAKFYIPKYKTKRCIEGGDINPFKCPGSNENCLCCTEPTNQTDLCEDEYEIPDDMKQSCLQSSSCTFTVPTVNMDGTCLNYTCGGFHNCDSQWVKVNYSCSHYEGDASTEPYAATNSTYQPEASTNLFLTTSTDSDSTDQPLTTGDVKQPDTTSDLNQPDITSDSNQLDTTSDLNKPFTTQDAESTNEPSKQGAASPSTSGPIGIIAGASAASLVVVTAIIVVIVLCHRKTHSSEKTQNDPNMVQLNDTIQASNPYVLATDIGSTAESNITHISNTDGNYALINGDATVVGNIHKDLAQIQGENEQAKTEIGNSDYAQVSKKKKGIQTDQPLNGEDMVENNYYERQNGEMVENAYYDGENTASGQLEEENHYYESQQIKKMDSNNGADTMVTNTYYDSSEVNNGSARQMHTDDAYCKEQPLGKMHVDDAYCKEQPVGSQMGADKPELVYSDSEMKPNIVFDKSSSGNGGTTFQEVNSKNQDHYAYTYGHFKLEGRQRDPSIKPKQ